MTVNFAFVNFLLESGVSKNKNGLLIGLHTSCLLFKRHEKSNGETSAYFIERCDWYVRRSAAKRIRDDAAIQWRLTPATSPSRLPARQISNEHNVWRRSSRPPTTSTFPSLYTAAVDLLQQPVDTDAAAHHLLTSQKAIQMWRCFHKMLVSYVKFLQLMRDRCLSPVWSLTTVTLIKKLRSVQWWFSKPLYHDFSRMTITVLCWESTARSFVDYVQI